MIIPPFRTKQAQEDDKMATLDTDTTIPEKHPGILHDESETSPPSGVSTPKTSNHGIVLIPQPSDDPQDPLVLSRPIVLSNI